jgi:hypothetical protein
MALFNTNPLTVMLWTVQISLPLVFGIHLYRGIPAEPDWRFWGLVGLLVAISALTLLAERKGASGLAALVSLLLFGCLFATPAYLRPYVGAVGLMPALFAGREAVARFRKHIGNV